MEKGSEISLQSEEGSSIGPWFNDFWFELAPSLNTEPLVRLRSTCRAAYRNKHIKAEYDLKVVKLFEEIGIEVLVKVCHGINRYLPHGWYRGLSFIGERNTGIRRAIHY